MKLTHARLALAHFALALLAFGACWTFACAAWPEPKPEAPKCLAYGLSIPAEPGKGRCVFAQLAVAQTVAELSSLPGFEASRLDGYVVELVGDNPRGFTNERGAFVGGDTDCFAKRIRLASLSYGLEHEVGHAMQGCPEDKSAPDEFARQHPAWRPTVCEALRRAGAYEGCGA